MAVAVAHYIADRPTDAAVWIAVALGFRIVLLLQAARGQVK
jgi:hypothetical protein